MTVELDEFHRDFFQEILASADADGEYVEDAFFDRFCEYLIDAGELETADASRYKSVGLRVDGYGGDPMSADGTLSLIVADFSQNPDLATLTGSEMDAIFKRATAFLAKAETRVFEMALKKTIPDSAWRT